MIRRIVYLLILTLIGTAASAQQPEPLLKAGTKLDFKFFLYGQSVTINMTVKSATDSVQLDWSLRGLARGSYLVSKEGFENGSKLNFVQPAASTVLRLAHDETFAIISKKAFRELKKDGKFVYNQTTYVLKNDGKEFKAGDLNLEVLHVVGLEEHGELWILDNPGFPLICQVKNNPVGINYTITALR